MKRLLTICLLAAISLGSFAQDKECKKAQMHEKFQADKVAFLSQKMDLTVKEAEAFWPIYNDTMTNSQGRIKNDYGYESL